MEAAPTLQLEGHFVVIFGPPGSGKTTLANQLQASILNSSTVSHSSFLCGRISADCCEEYLRTHSTSQLEKLLSTEQGWAVLAQFRLKRQLFSEQLWRQSRDFIKQLLPVWLKQWKIVILEDDLLLKSQRKQMRQLVQYTDIRFIEMYSTASAQQCQRNLKKRASEVSGEEQMDLLKAKDLYGKFEVEKTPFCYPVEGNTEVYWEAIQKLTRRVEIEHPELRQKQAVSEENAAKDSVETQIRTFISSIMSSPELRTSYFKGLEVKAVAARLGKMKKDYNSKNKTLEGFIAYLTSETSKLI